MGKRSPFFPGANKRLWRELFTNKYTDSSVNFTQKNSAHSNKSLARYGPRCRFFTNLNCKFLARVTKVVWKNMFHNFFLSSHRLLRSKLIRINTDTYFTLSHKKFQVIRLNRQEEMASCRFFTKSELIISRPICKVCMGKRSAFISRPLQAVMKGTFQ